MLWLPSWIPTPCLSSRWPIRFTLHCNIFPFLNHGYIYWTLTIKLCNMAGVTIGAEIDDFSGTSEFTFGFFMGFVLLFFSSLVLFNKKRRSNIVRLRRVSGITFVDYLSCLFIFATCLFTAFFHYFLLSFSFRPLTFKYPWRTYIICLINNTCHGQALF